jgi:hypothetical protein
MTLAVTSTWLLVLRSEMVLLVCCQVVQEIDAIHLNKNKIMEDGGMRLQGQDGVGRWHASSRARPLPDQDHRYIDLDNLLQLCSGGIRKPDFKAGCRGGRLLIPPRPVALRCVSYMNVIYVDTNLDQASLYKSL